MKQLYLLALLLCSSCAGHVAQREQDAGASRQWNCFCGGNYSTTCTRGKLICDATDPSKRVAQSEGTTCTCVDAGPCVRDADCIAVHAPQQ